MYHSLKYVIKKITAHTLRFGVPYNTNFLDEFKLSIGDNPLRAGYSKGTFLMQIQDSYGSTLSNGQLREQLGCPSGDYPNTCSNIVLTLQKIAALDLPDDQYDHLFSPSTTYVNPTKVQPQYISEFEDLPQALPSS
ncbi:hypothetical protein RDI58_000614 [Solanum bulbocastanum]|uniref:Uncharacterized protein n=1 Tax=Solanum bulbocastanum TaxID=147425 RepID=A0AAN8YP85_SOLBU